jgi:hypothetical protein
MYVLKEVLLLGFFYFTSVSTLLSASFSFFLPVKASTMLNTVFFILSDTFNLLYKKGVRSDTLVKSNFQLR